MKKHAIVLGLLMVMGLGLASNADARDHAGCCCDPNLARIQTQCCQGTLLPYHIALKRADDATKAETAIAQVTQERNDLQARVAQLQAELKTAVAERDKALREKDVAAEERDLARDEAAVSAKTAKEQQARAQSAKQAAEAALKAKQEADAAASKANEELAKVKDDVVTQSTAAQAEIKRFAEEKDMAVAELKKSADEVAELRIKLAAILATEDKKKDKKDDSKNDEPKQDAKREDEFAEVKSED